MDKLSGLASKLSGDKKSESSEQSGSAGAQKEDYLDKGLDLVESKFGQGKVDPQKMRSTNEKITDTAREQFEKVSGHKVPEKFSN